MLADYLFGQIALETLGARVPAYDGPARIEHVDRVVPDACNKKLKALGVAQFREVRCVARSHGVELQVGIEKLYRC
jgi:hypothetical protein